MASCRQGIGKHPLKIEIVMTADNEKRRFDKRERRILVTASYGHFLSHVNMMVFPAVLLPMAQSLGLTMAEALDISFWMYLFFGITALPWGLAADRFGARPFMAIYFLGAGISSFSAAWEIDSIRGLTFSLAFLGLFSGIYHPTGLGLISKEIDRVSMAMGLNGIFGNLGLAVAPLLAGVLNYVSGPRSVYLFLGLMNLSGCVLLKALPASGSLSVSDKPDGNDEKGMLSAFAILLVAMMLGGIAYRGATVILPAYFELKTQDILIWLTSASGQQLSTNLVATLIVFFIYLTGMAGQYTGGRSAERFDPRICYLLFHAVPIPIVMLMATAADLPLVFLAMIYLLFLLGMQPIENTLVASLSPKKFHHSAYGTKFILTFGVGALAIKLVNAVEKTTSIEGVFVAMGLISVSMVGVILLLISRTKWQSP